MGEEAGQSEGNEAADEELRQAMQAAAADIDGNTGDAADAADSGVEGNV